jgi:hypothetical protein
MLEHFENISLMREWLPFYPWWVKRLIHLTTSSLGCGRNSAQMCRGEAEKWVTIMRRAKDMAGLRKAVTAKMQARRQLGVWWEAQPKYEGRPSDA